MEIFEQNEAVRRACREAGNPDDGCRTAGRHRSSKRMLATSGFGLATLRGVLRDRKGAAAIEFAILVIPFLLVILASIETFVAFTGEQILANATQTMARKIRTGALPADMSQTQFRAAFCNELTALLTCSGTEAANASKLLIDVRSYASFSAIPTAIPRTGSDLNTAGFGYAPGGPGSINLIRAYYRWTVVTDLVRPFVTNLRPAGSSMPNDYLMATTAAFLNEKY